MKFTKRHNPFPIVGPYAGIYAHGVEVKSAPRTLYVSGQVGQDNEGNIAVGFEAQAKLAMSHVFRVLQEANMSYEDIVKMNFYLINSTDLSPLVNVRKQLLDGVSPAITTLVVAELVHPDWLIEVEVIAVSQTEEFS